MIFHPGTLIGWRRTGFRVLGRWKSRCRLGRPEKDQELIRLIRRIWSANSFWKTFLQNHAAASLLWTTMMWGMEEVKRNDVAALVPNGGVSQGIHRDSEEIRSARPWVKPDDALIDYAELARRRVVPSSRYRLGSGRT